LGPICEEEDETPIRVTRGTVPEASAMRAAGSNRFVFVLHVIHSATCERTARPNYCNRAARRAFRQKINHRV
jgi:hypothetical protein